MINTTYHRWYWDHIRTIPIMSLTPVIGSDDTYWKSKSDTFKCLKNQKCSGFTKASFIAVFKMENPYDDKVESQQTVCCCSVD